MIRFPTALHRPDFSPALLLCKVSAKCCIWFGRALYPIYIKGRCKWLHKGSRNDGIRYKGLILISFKLVLHQCHSTDFLSYIGTRAEGSPRGIRDFEWVSYRCRKEVTSYNILQLPPESLNHFWIWFLSCSCYKRILKRSHHNTLH